MCDSAEGYLECGTCLADLRGVSGPIQQCAQGHLQCSGCFAVLGGAAALCPSCQLPIGDIRNRLAESLRDWAQLTAQNASPAAAGSVDPLWGAQGAAERVVGCSGAAHREPRGCRISLYFSASGV